MDWWINFALLIFGFGFVIFWHELGHFLAAKWAGVKVEQFAVGFGQALVSYRKGLGVRFGRTGPEYERLAKQQLADEGREFKNATPYQLDEAAAEVGLSPTEYRLNWMPLGGYVKMLGQDDLRPGEQHEDPRSYNKATVGKRMVIISAGVVMNVILAATIFWGLFTHGFNSNPPILGSVAAGSPAQQAGLRPGDELLTFDGDVMHDFTKISLAVPLSTPGETVPITFRRDGEVIEADVTPVQTDNAPMATIGIGPMRELDVLDYSLEQAIELRGEPFALLPGERVVAADGVELSGTDFPKLHRLARAAAPGDVTLSVEADDGTRREVSAKPQLSRRFDGYFGFGGVLPRVRVDGTQPETTAAEFLEVGDVFLAVRPGGTEDWVEHPAQRELVETIKDAAEANLKGFFARLISADDTTGTLDAKLLRGGEVVTVEDMPIMGSTGGYRLGFTVGFEEAATVGKVERDSPLAGLGLKRGQTIAAVNGEAVGGWLEVDAAFAAAEAGEVLTLTTEDGQTFELTPDAAAAAVLGQNTYTLDVDLLFDEYLRLRQADNAGQALWWGVTETRDLVLKFYLTLKQIVVGNVSATNLNGPVGIVHAGTILSDKGTDWMFWFLGLISANLAVVNFLPLPVVDGGHFCFLLWEKVRGKPASPSVQIWTQLAGIVLFAGLFLFVTYNDLLRLI